MDRHAAILDALPGLRDRLEQGGVRRWLDTQKRVTVGGESYVLLGGDRLASEAEAMLSFASERGLVSDADLRRAAAGQPLPDDVEAVEIDTKNQGDV